MLWPFNMTMDMECLPQQWLKQPGRSLEQLAAEYKITAKRHGLYPNLVQLKYSQLESNFHNPMVRQCRGIILDSTDNWRPVAWPFDKFGNHGESYAAAIDWNTSTIQEKLDGSLIIMYWYNNSWMVSTSGMPDASGEVDGYGMTFAELFWDTWIAKKYKLPNEFQRNFTFMFELMSPFNKIVVRHSKPDIKLIGVRNTITGREMPVRDQMRWDTVKEFAPLRDMDILLKTFEGMDPCRQEGYVVVDRDFNRIKVKHPGYVMLHRMRDKLTPKGVLEVVRNGECSEVIVAFPEWIDLFDRVQARYDALAMQLDQTFSEIRDVQPRKDFAELAKLSILPPVLFLLLDGKVSSAKQAMKDMHIERLMEVLGMRRLFVDSAMPMTLVEA